MKNIEEIEARIECYEELVTVNQNIIDNEELDNCQRDIHRLVITDLEKRISVLNWVLNKN